MTTPKTFSSQSAAANAALSLAPEHGVSLRVRGADGRVQTILFTAVSAEDAVRKAAARGLQVLAIEQRSDAVQSRATSSRSAFPLLLFTQELLALLDAGLNLPEALGTLLAKERQPAARGVLSQLLEALREGKNLSDVLAAQPRHFPEVYVATVRASERTGDLPRALARYITYQLQFDAMRKKLVAAALYPAMLLVVGGFVTLFLLGYVVPRFSIVYEQSGREIPWLSGVLLAFGRFIYGHWFEVGAGVAAVGTSALVLLLRPDGRAMLARLVLRLPFLARKADDFRLARFFRATSLLLLSGIALPKALAMVTGLLGPAQQVRLARARAAVDQGQSLSAALALATLSDPVADSLVKVGERSGQLAEMLERTARFHDDEFGRWIEWVSKLLEPTLMLLIGLVIGSVVVLLYMPIFELAGSLG